MLQGFFGEGNEADTCVYRICMIVSFEAGGLLSFLRLGRAGVSGRFQITRNLSVS